MQLCELRAVAVGRHGLPLHVLGTPQAIERKRHRVARHIEVADR